MNRLLALMAFALLALAAGCDTMPEEDPGYHVRHRPTGADGPARGHAAAPTPTAPDRPT